MNRGIFVLVGHAKSLCIQATAGGTSKTALPLAKPLAIPAELTIHAKGMARSMAATAAVFQKFAPDPIWAGAITNKYGSPGHLEILSRAMNALPSLEALPLQNDGSSEHLEAIPVWRRALSNFAGV
jgi:cobyrinic acid a,c-diamide synthase